MQYDWTQLREIELAKKKELDTSFMEDPRYLAEQMQEIRMGLEAGLDVSVYAKPEFDWFQVEQIRMGLEENVDVSIYAFSRYSYETMKQLRLAWHTFVDLQPYLNDGFEGEELGEIRQALEKELSIGEWITKGMYSYQIREILLGLEQGLDVFHYADSNFSWRQMKEIRLGLERRLDVSLYAKPLMKPKQMAEIRLGLERGLDVSSYASMLYSGIEMKAKRLALQAERGETEPAAQDIRSSIVIPEHLSKINLIVEDGGMKAYLYIDGGRKDSFTGEELIQELKKKGIVAGILEDQIKKIASGKMFGKKVLVAEGIKAEKGHDGWYEFFVRTDLGNEPILLPDGSVDYLDFDAYETVKAGQKLAVYHSSLPGTDGKDLFGNLIPAEAGREKPTLRGIGFVVDQDKITYRAKKAGRFEFVNGKIEISNVVVIQEDVTGVFGRVVVDGTVHVRGNVCSGGYIEAAEDIIVDGNVEAAKLKAGKNIILRRGACSKKECYIEAGGRVSGNFFEAANIRAIENINANYIMNSRIKTLGKVIVSGKKGAVIGGKISAVRGVETYNIGNEADITTILDIGKNDVYNEYLRKLRIQKENILEDIRIFEEGLKKISRYNEEEKEVHAAMISKLELGIKMKKAEQLGVDHKMEKLVQCAEKLNMLPAVVRGRAYAGTVVMIDRVSYLLPQDVDRIIFTKRNKKVVMVKI